MKNAPTELVVQDKKKENEDIDLIYQKIKDNTDGMRTTIADSLSLYYKPKPRPKPKMASIFKPSPILPVLQEGEGIRCHSSKLNVIEICFSEEKNAVDLCRRLRKGLTNISQKEDQKKEPKNILEIGGADLIKLYNFVNHMDLLMNIEKEYVRRHEFEEQRNSRRGRILDSNFSNACDESDKPDFNAVYYKTLYTRIVDNGWEPTEQDKRNITPNKKQQD